MSERIKCDTADLAGEVQGKVMDLTPNTRVPLFWFLGGMVFVASFTIAHFSTLWSIKADLSTMGKTIEFIDGDYWSKTQQEIFALKLRLMNSNISIPEVHEVRRKSP